MPCTRLPWFALGLAAALAAAPPARAEGSDADTLFRQGVELADKGQFAAAADRFDASYRAEPALGTLQGLAMAEHNSGRLAAALKHYRVLHDLARLTHDVERERAASARITELEPRVPTITLRLTAALPAGASVLLDDTPVLPESIGAAIPVDPGAHSVALVGSRIAPVSQRLSVETGARKSVELRVQVLKPSQAQTDPAGRSNAYLRGFGVASGVVGLAAVVAGASLWVQSNRHYGEASDMCPGPNCDAYAHSSIESGRSLQRASGVCLAIGGISVATGIALFVAGSRSESQSQARLQLGPGSVQVAGTF